MSIVEAKRQLAAAALLGTDRLGNLPETALPERITGAAARCEQAADRLLAQIVMSAQYASAGVTPGASSGEAQACPEVTEPVADDRFAGLLALAEERDRRLLRECLKQLQRRRLSAPFRSLPMLLEHGRTHKRDRELVRTTAGTRGRWLATVNQAWSYAAGMAAAGTLEEAAARWTDAGVEERTAILADVRAADPARGLRMVEESWASETPEAKARLLEALQVGLGMQDEAFLETVLDDPRKPVRSAAAALLANLPESRLVQRMIDRARGMVAITTEKRPLKSAPKVVIEADPPEDPDEAMKRDGLEARPFADMGRKASLLSRIVAAVPPRFWSDMAGVEPDALLGAAKKSEWNRALLLGWMEAAARFADAAWASALLGVQPGKNVPASEADTALVRVLAATRDDDALRYLIERHAKSTSMLWNIARGMEDEWGRDASRAMIAAIDAAARKATGMDLYRGSTLRGVTTLAALHMAPDTIEEAREIAADLQKSEQTHDLATEILETLDFRARLLKETDQ